MASKRNVRYKALSTEDQDECDDAGDDGKDLRFSYTPKKYNRIPWKSIALAIFLLLLGTVLLLLSYFIHTGHMPGDSSQANGLLFLGILAFLPGMHF
jgi:Transmembrane proteins 230/134